jgi:hypothetical protein
VSEFRSHPSVMADCISSCTACESLCIETLAHCELKGGNFAKPKLVSLLAVCADICALSARTMQRGSEAHVFICGACAEVCKRCAETCSAFPDDPLLRACASACTMCSRCCADMASMPPMVAEELQRRA